ncbi:GNAS [Mytilus edulis]|uniref:GNAS n=1 Tax=Mytilus edulis TaxID=6550 RepID=A0A8S3TEP8_MYTED|nr:GNAS [Mytilus edulis]
MLPGGRLQCQFHANQDRQSVQECRRVLTSSTWTVSSATATLTPPISSIFIHCLSLMYQNTLNAYKRSDKAVSVALGACSVVSLVLTSSTLGSALTGTGVIATIPLGFLACLNATTVMDLTLISRHVIIKKKHHDTLRLPKSKKSLVEQCVSSALANDEQIYDVEFGKVVTCLKNYYDHKD